MTAPTEALDQKGLEAAYDAVSELSLRDLSDPHGELDGLRRREGVHAALRAYLASLAGQAAPVAEPSRDELRRMSSNHAEEFANRVFAAPPPPAPIGGGWLPIETAPKDGTRVLTWQPHCDASPHEAILHWNGDKWVEDNGTWFVRAPHYWMSLSGFAAPAPIGVSEAALRSRIATMKRELADDKAITAFEKGQIAALGYVEQMIEQLAEASLAAPLQRGEDADFAEGVALVENRLAIARVARHDDAPFPFDAEQARLWHEAQASAFQYCLEMLNAPAATPPVAPNAPGSIRNEEHRFVEFINADVPYIVREIEGQVAVLLDMESRNVIGYRVYDPARSVAPNALVERLLAAWEALPEGSHTLTRVEKWLAEDMAPAFAGARAALAGRRNGTEPRDG